MAEVLEINVDLSDEASAGNQMFANLLDDGRWKQLAKEYDGGRGEQPLSELLLKLLEGQ